MNIGDVTTVNAVRDELERRANAGTFNRTRIRHHTVPPATSLRPGPSRSSPALDPASRRLNWFQFDFARLDPLSVTHRTVIVCTAMPHIILPVDRFTARATDSRAHLPMSAEPFLVSDHARRMSARFSKYTTRPAGQFGFVGRWLLGKRAASAAILNFLPLANQHVDDSCGIASGRCLRCTVTLSEKNSTPTALKSLCPRHSRVPDVIFSLSHYMIAQFFERKGRVAPQNEALQILIELKMESKRRQKHLTPINT